MRLHSITNHNWNTKRNKLPLTYRFKYITYYFLFLSLTPLSINFLFARKSITCDLGIAIPGCTRNYLLMAVRRNIRWGFAARIWMTVEIFQRAPLLRQIAPNGLRLPACRVRRGCFSFTFHTSLYIFTAANGAVKAITLCVSSRDCFTRRTSSQLPTGRTRVPRVRACASPLSVAWKVIVTRDLHRIGNHRVLINVRHSSKRKGRNSGGAKGGKRHFDAINVTPRALKNSQ